MSAVRVMPWQDDTLPPPPPELLAGMKARRPDGELIGIDRVLLRSVPLATGWNALLGRVRAEFGLALEHRELIMLRVAVLNRADFEWGVHHPAYLAAGGTEEKCEALKENAVDSGVFDEEERALLALTDQSTKRVEVDALLIEEMKRLFGEVRTVEAVATVAAYNMVSRFLVALAV
ncbi:carboxymuconolactone decarboxylase family protein [Streptomyces halstedii]|uniref:Carboxymuconolactone decarboxylase family protein n=1 Tax=Streptomyces halstedii TaxID=1944 RepID=A0ABS6TV12_STRHA|nr:carboxymuconolactone decarboxylase family protein [Streptomyces halstedii]MBV7672049.1 carboxymuconolactone decarboxylase family protein [Streptomyces halstedii]